MRGEQVVRYHEAQYGVAQELHSFVRLRCELRIFVD
jgi:hypothetical protein